MKELDKITLNVDHSVIDVYSELTGDLNPIHLDEEFASKTVIGRVIAHGTLAVNLIWQSFEATFGSERAKDAILEVRFVKPVYPGDRIEACGFPAEAAGSYEVYVRNQDGLNVVQGRITEGPLAPGAVA